MTDAPDHPSSDGPDLALEKAAEARRAAEEQAFADKLAKRPPPNLVERAAIEKARRRTKARAPRIAMHIEDRAFYPDHSDDEARRRHCFLQERPEPAPIATTAGGRFI